MLVLGPLLRLARCSSPGPLQLLVHCYSLVRVPGPLLRLARCSSPGLLPLLARCSSLVQVLGPLPLLARCSSLVLVLGPLPLLAHCSSLVDNPRQLLPRCCRCFLIGNPFLSSYLYHYFPKAFYIFFFFFGALPPVFPVTLFTSVRHSFFHLPTTH